MMIDTVIIRIEVFNCYPYFKYSYGSEIWNHLKKIEWYKNSDCALNLSLLVLIISTTHHLRHVIYMLKKMSNLIWWTSFIFQGGRGENVNRRKVERIERNDANKIVRVQMVWCANSESNDPKSSSRNQKSDIFWSSQIFVMK